MLDFPAEPNARTPAGLPAFRVGAYYIHEEPGAGWQAHYTPTHRLLCLSWSRADAIRACQLDAVAKPRRRRKNPELTRGEVLAIGRAGA